MLSPEPLADVYVSTGLPMAGGRIGFRNGREHEIDSFTLVYDSDDDGDFDANDTVEMVETFDSGDELVHDNVGNLIYDGLYSYTYDAWNRLATVSRAYPDTDSDGEPEIGSTIATLSYDAAGRRIAKAVTGCGDWDQTYEYYYDGQRMIEMRDDSADVVKQYVWGLGYVDELVQVAANGTYYAMQDANYNLLGLIDAGGRLAERYEYTPYGERTVYTHGVLYADFDADGDVDLDDFQTLMSNFGTGTTHAEGDANGDVDLDDFVILKATFGGRYPAADPLVTQPRPNSFALPATGRPALCDIGHQGLLHDKEFGLVYNRARYLSPTLGRFNRPDPMDQNQAGGGYQDGMNRGE